MSKLVKFVALSLTCGLAIAIPVSAVQAQIPQPTATPRTVPNSNPMTRTTPKPMGKKCRNKNGRMVRCKPVVR